MLHVALEAGGYAQLCMVCAPEREEPHDALYVVLWERDHGERGEAGMVRLCWEHLDELAILMAEVL